MRMRFLMLAVIAAAALAPLSSSATSMRSEEASGTAFGGRVKSADEGAMEGVLVSARADGSSMTTTVVSDEQGRYTFPASTLPRGHYSLRIRAVGYELEGPKAVDVGGDGTI